MKKNFLLLLLIFLGVFRSYGQTDRIKGVVVDRWQNPIISASILCTQDRNKVSISDIDGSFELSNIKGCDSIKVSHLLYESVVIPISSLSLKDTIKVILAEKTIELGELEVRAMTPITHRLSVSKMTEMDFYRNPIAQGDPLNAIMGLAASNSTSEMANPEFRGSPAEYTIVTLNKVPIESPVRYSQLNNQGLFSLFHPSLIDAQWIYPSNPPVIAGKALSGLVDIRTKERLYRNNTYLSLGIGGVGLVHSRKLSTEGNFVQIYSNAQFSDAMLAISPSSYPEAKSFYSGDLGINLRLKLSPSISLNFYNYGIIDKVKAESGDMNYFGSVHMKRTRYFNVFNLKRTHSLFGITTLNLGYDINSPKTAMGNLDITESKQNTYLSLNHKLLLKHLELEGGISLSTHRYDIKGKMPVYRYLRRIQDPQTSIEQGIHYGSIDGYLYAYAPIWTNFLDASIGVRTIRPLGRDQKLHFSYQGALKFHLSKHHSVFFGGGSYTSFASPTAYMANTPILTSKQINLDYEYKQKQRVFKFATYWKKEDLQFQTYSTRSYESRFEAVPSWGLEATWEDELASYLSYNLSLSAQRLKFLIPHIGINKAEEWSYFAKSSIQYSSPRWGNVSLAYTMRRGNYISIVDTGLYIPDLKGYVPKTIGTRKLPIYQRFDLAMSKQFSIGKSMLTVFISVSNLFNHQNIRSYYYSEDYKKQYALYLQQRSVYWGCVFIL